MHLLTLASILGFTLAQSQSCQPCNKKAILLRIMPEGGCGGEGISPQTVSMDGDRRRSQPTGSSNSQPTVWEMSETKRVCQVPANARIVRRVTTIIVNGKPQLTTKQETVTKTVTQLAILEKRLLSTSAVTTIIKKIWDAGRPVTVTSTVTLDAIPSEDPKYTTVIKEIFVTLVKEAVKAPAADIIPKDQMLKAVEAYFALGIVKGTAAVTDEFYQAYVKYVTPALSLLEQLWFLATVLVQSQGFTKLDDKNSSDPFHARGLMGLGWDGNYKAASDYIYKDDRLFKNPDLVAQPEGSWLTALWFWMTQVHPKLVEKNALDSGDYGIVVDTVNGAGECTGGPTKIAQQRAKLLEDLYALFKQSGKINLTGCQRVPPADVKVELPKKKENELSKEQIQTIFDTWTKAGGWGTVGKVSDEMYQAYLTKVAPIMDMKEQAQFLALLVYQTNGLQKQPTKECIDGILDKCPEGKYYGRGLMNLSWDFNYQAASKALYDGKDDLFNNPNLASTPEGSWLTALWFWNANIRQRLIDNKALDNNEYGLTVDAVNGFNECKGGPSKEANTRLKIYNEVLLITKVGGTGKLEFCNRPGDPKPNSGTSGTGTSTTGTGTSTTGTGTGTSTSGTTPSGTPTSSSGTPSGTDSGTPSTTSAKVSTTPAKASTTPAKASTTPDIIGAPNTTPTRDSPTSGTFGNNALSNNPKP